VTESARNPLDRAGSVEDEHSAAQHHDHLGCRRWRGAGWRDDCLCVLRDRVVDPSSCSMAWVARVGTGAPPIDQLAESGRLVVPDLVGFGRSERPATGYTAEDHADAVAGCLDALDIEAPVVIGAHSLGCLVALALAARHPSRVSALVGAGPPLYAPLGWLERQFAFGNRRARCSPGPVTITRRRHVWPASPAPRYHRRSSSTGWSTRGAPTPRLNHLLLAARGDAWVADVAVPVQMLVGDHDRVPDLAHPAATGPATSSAPGHRRRRRRP